MRYYVILAILFRLINSQQNFEIEDIPIEHFVHADAENDAFDVELMPRSSRSLFTELNFEEKPFLFDDPTTVAVNTYKSRSRHVREVDQSDLVTALSNDKKHLVETLGQPLEISVIDPENTTQKSTQSNTVSSTIDLRDEANFLINDFIRFRRASEQDHLNGGASSEEKSSKKETSDTSNHPTLEKLIMDPNETQKQRTDNTRETRGATKEQWSKQPYPVRRGDDDLPYDDNIQSPNNVRAPRVHFVTQDLEEQSPLDRKFNREGRARDLNKEITRNLARDMSTEMDFYQPRYTRNYDPGRYRQPKYFEPYYNNFNPRDPRERYPHDDRSYDYPERLRNDYNSGNKRQRRIIYYATLPEVPRPPSMDLRERHDYRDRYYDDRYYTPDPYRYRKAYIKPRYEERAMDKSPYPVKVSTDLSVREVKKNPETRIYSEVERNGYAQSGRI